MAGRSSRLISAVALVAAMAACSSSTTVPGAALSTTSPIAVPDATGAAPPGPIKRPRGGYPDPSTVKDSSSGAVTRAGLRAMYGWDTAKDQTPADAISRAAPWLTPDYAGNAIEAAQQAGADASWIKWTKVGAYAEVTLDASGEDRPPDTDTTVWRSYIVSIRMRDADGHQVDTRTVTTFVQLVRATIDGPWRIDQIRAN